jgi:hypothetical protein
VSATNGPYSSFGFGLGDTDLPGCYFAVEIPDPSQKYVVGRIRGRSDDISGPIATCIPDFDISMSELIRIFEERLDVMVWNAPEVDTPESQPQVHSPPEFSPTLAFDPDEKLKLEAGNSCSLYSSSMTLTPLTKYPFLSSRVFRILLNPALITSPAYPKLHFLRQQRKRAMNRRPQTETLSLEKCFEYFSMSEILDENNQWFCPKCRNFVRANKKMDIWSLAQNMIIHFKRFICRTGSSRKIEGLIKFPVELDMAPYVVGPQKDAEQKYQIYAVCEHFGGTGGGHYTAHCRVPMGNGDFGWYSFNDMTVRKSSVSEIHSEAAYVLFYEKVEASGGGGEVHVSRASWSSSSLGTTTSEAKEEEEDEE